MTQNIVTELLQVYGLALGPLECFISFICHRILIQTLYSAPPTPRCVYPPRALAEKLVVCFFISMIRPVLPPAYLS